MLASPFVRRSGSMIGFHKTCTKWMVFVCHLRVFTHWRSMCTNTLWLEGHPALFSWLCGGFLLPVNLSCGAHGPTVVGWLWGHWQGYWGKPGACRARKWHWADSTLIASIQRCFLFPQARHPAFHCLASHWDSDSTPHPLSGLLFPKPILRQQSSLFHYKAVGPR